MKEEWVNAKYNFTINKLCHIMLFFNTRCTIITPNILENLIKLSCMKFKKNVVNYLVEGVQQNIKDFRNDCNIF